MYWVSLLAGRGVYGSTRDSVSFLSVDLQNFLGRGGVVLARFARMTYVGKLADLQLGSPADLPTKINKLANDTYHLVVSRELVRTRSSINEFINSAVSSHWVNVRNHSINQSI